ncbi:MAG: hypothetical protein ACPHXR_06965 [Flavicella sp.]
MFSILFSSCHLGLEDSYEFVPTYEVIPGFGAKTAWEWLQEEAGNEDLEFMRAVIEKTELIDEYNSKDEQKTFFLIIDSALNLLMTVELGKTGSDDFYVFLDSLDSSDLDKLRNLIAYHILNEFVDQGNQQLSDINTSYYFETLSQDPSNKEIELSKSFDLTIHINRAYSPNGRSTFVRRHNYVFSNENAVAHVIYNYVKAN